jgi:hypothetical protein
MAGRLPKSLLAIFTFLLTANSFIVTGSIREVTLGKSRLPALRHGNLRDHRGGKIQ